MDRVKTDLERQLRARKYDEIKKIKESALDNKVELFGKVHDLSKGKLVVTEDLKIKFREASQ